METRTETSRTTSDATKGVHVIWRRPDGFHGAHPSDFRVVEIGDSRIWLHKRDRNEFPFKVSGGWGESTATSRLNNLINSIDEPVDSFARFLEKAFDHAVEENPDAYVDSTLKWIGELQTKLKGDTWEVEIMSSVLKALVDKIRESKSAFGKLVSRG
jgi:hypothetical protein